MPDRPAEMYRNGRPIIPDFDPNEWLYYRLDPARIQSDGFVDPVSIPCPNLSSNRQKLSQSWYVLYPRDRFGHWAVYKFQRETLPPTLQAEGLEATVYTVRTEHDPHENNYGHCETRLYRGEEAIPAIQAQVNKHVKNKFRLKFARVITLERTAGLPFPPQA